MPYLNLAARMESHGEGNKIHCSEETANLLIIAGKRHWLILRGDKINAKGKGVLQTYWVDTSIVEAWNNYIFLH